MSGQPVQSIGATSNRRRRSAAVDFALSLLALAAAVLLRYALDGWLDSTLPLVTLYGAIAGAVWIGGYKPAIVVAILGYVACLYLFMQPRYILTLDRLQDVIGVAAYTSTCLVIIVLGEAARR